MRNPHMNLEENPESEEEQPPETGSGPDGLNPDLTRQETVRGERAGDQYVRVQQPYAHLFRRVSPGYLRATEQALAPQTPLRRAWFDFKRVLLGSPLATEREIHERLTKVKALAIFASDAMSSVAYAGEEILLALLVAGSAALGFSVWISLLIALLLSIVAFSYRQTVFAYPNGGGSYIVAHENISVMAGLVAASALMLDYVLTVAVSISSGTAAITSAFPVLQPYTVGIAVGFVAIITLGNLRGIRESGSIFAVPTYAFIFGVVGMLILGVYRVMTGVGPAEAVAAGPLPAQEPLTLWLLLTAFSAGSVAMSGTEAISNGVPSFKPPESKNAATTLTVMATILGVFFVGISLLANYFGIAPREGETVISQLARAAFGNNLLYYYFSFATMGILVVAANTAFNGFPALSSILARDDYMPHSFGLRGDRLAFSTGITALGVIAAGLIIAFGGDTHLLIPLYAIGVFLSFTLSQAGMVIHWRRLRQPGWQLRAAINAVGAVLTSIVLLIAAATKFVHGAWIIILAIPILVSGFMNINRHYRSVDRDLRLTSRELVPPKLKLFTIVVVPAVNYATQRALAFARTVSKNVTAVTVAYTREQGEKVRAMLREYDPDIQHVVLEDPYRSFYQPLIRYIESLHAADPDVFVTVVIPEFVVRNWWERYLHNRAAARLTDIFRSHPNVAVVNVPYLLPGQSENGERLVRESTS